MGIGGVKGKVMVLKVKGDLIENKNLGMWNFVLFLL